MLERGCYECLVEIRARQRTVLRGIAPIGLALAILAPMACEDQMMPAEAPPSPATMPRAPQLAASGATTETAAVEIADAGTLADESRHAVIITTCSIDRNGCLLAQPSSPPDDSSYRVVFGGGVGAIRTRTQAMADLYKEIRDRTSSGAHLAAETHHLGDPPPGQEGAKAAPRLGTGDDPIIEAAFQLMDAVDRDGEVTIDSLPMRGPRTCKLSIGPVAVDAGEIHCLVKAPTSSPLEDRSARPANGR